MKTTRDTGDDTGEIVQEMLLGSGDALAKFVRRYQAKVRSYLGRFVRDGAAVDDLAQETFIAAYRSLDSFKGDSSISLWLLGIARNLALKHLREKQQRPLGERVGLEVALDAWSTERLQAEGSSESRHEGVLTALRSCMENLQEHGAGLVREHYFKGRPAAEIARKIGKTEGAVWVTLMRLRQALKECIRTRLAGAEAR